MAGSSTTAGRSFCWHATLCLALGFVPVGAVVTRQAMAAEQRDGSVESSVSMEFDLPAQPLALALERYSVASGWQIIYDSNLATGLRSAGVRGNLPPSAALRMLLAGTGLVPQYMAADGVMLGYGGGGDDTPNQDPQNPDSRGKKRDQQSYDPDSAVHLLGNGQLTEEQKKSLSDEEKSKLDRLVGQRSSLQ